MLKEAPDELIIQCYKVPDEKHGVSKFLGIEIDEPKEDSTSKRLKTEPFEDNTAFENMIQDLKPDKELSLNAAETPFIVS